MSQPAAADRPVQDLLALKRTPLGLLTQAKCSPLLFSQIVERLRHLAAAPETKKARAEADAVLRCSWWGLRVIAIKAIASWGGSANKTWLVQRALRGRPDGGTGSKEVGWWSVETSAAMRAVVAGLDASDAGWVLTLSHENVRAQFIFYHYVKQLPDDVFLGWLPTPLRDSRGDLRVRLTNMVGQRKTLPNYMTLMQSFESDECGKVAEAARKWIAEQPSDTALQRAKKNDATVKPAPSPPAWRGSWRPRAGSRR